MKNITIKWDAHDQSNVGWAYYVDGVDSDDSGESGAIDGRAADAIGRLVDHVEPMDGDTTAILAAVGARRGDSLRLDLCDGSYIDVAAVLGLDE